MQSLNTIVRSVNKFRWLILGLAILLGLGFYPRPEEKPEGRKSEVINNLMYQVLKSSHYAPQEVNNAFSQRVYDAYLEELDGGKRFFTAQDLEELSQYRNVLDQQYKSSNFSFFRKVRSTFEQRRDLVQGYYREILAEPFDYSQKDFFETDAEKRKHPQNEEELRQHWQLYLKHRSLARLEEYLHNQEEKAEKSDTLEIKSREELQAKARKKVLESHDRWFENLAEMKDMDWTSGYFNAIANQYDPHTRYYPPQQQEDFEINMTGQLEGIGAQLQEKGDFIEVTKIITGSACWKQGDLEVGDKIIRVEQGDKPKEDPVDLIGMSVRDAVRYIRGPKGTTVILTVQKVDGAKQTIAIERDVVELESTFAKSAIVGQGANKVGYIRLPKFYVKFYSDHNRDVSDDIKAELEKLKDAGVSGVILDLRNNGGGALGEVVEIAGHFIDEGPVVQVKPSGRKPKILEDEDSGVVYDGPLAVMVNRFSASASEIFAAAIQDHQRGVVIGSESTFGKGTVQNVLDMDRAVGGAYKDLKPLGSLKLTIQKFYRIDGGTTQKRGVIPDIILPDTYGDFKMGERDRETALPYDEIESLDYQPWSDFTQLEALQKSSEKRVRKSAKFQIIADYAQWVSENRKETREPLLFEAYQKSQERDRKLSEQFKGMRKSDSALAVSPNKADLESINANEDSKRKAENWHEDVGEDVYIHETYRVLQDWATKEVAQR